MPRRWQVLEALKMDRAIAEDLRMNEFAAGYLAGVRSRLLEAGFEVDAKAQAHFSLVATRPFGPARGEGFGPPLLVFSVFDELDPSGLRAFSDSVLAYLWAEHPEHGLGRRNIMLYCPVAVVRQLDAALIDFVEGRAGEKKFKSFVSFPVVVDPESGDAYYYRRTPIIGAVYFRGFRRLASTVIADEPDATAA